MQRAMQRNNHAMQCNAIRKLYNPNGRTSCFYGVWLIVPLLYVFPLLAGGYCSLASLCVCLLAAYFYKQAPMREGVDSSGSSSSVEPVDGTNKTGIVGKCTCCMQQRIATSMACRSVC
jgi:hypothetical protein